MDSSRRAVESYWRSRMIDAATSDEDKVTPVYKLEEISDMLRSSHVSIVNELSDFVLKRLDHKSPLVKQKESSWYSKRVGHRHCVMTGEMIRDLALRLIKYCVGKSGAEFRREMQRNSVAVRQLLHYRGQPDPLKGDALNKAVRDTAHEAISAIFSEQNKPEPSKDINKRIQGFGNANFEMPSDDKKSFLSEVVGIGSASIKQGLSSFAQARSARKNENGNYKSPNLHRSLTLEGDNSGRYEPVRLPSETQQSFGGPNNGAGAHWDNDSMFSNAGTANGDSSSSSREGKTREEKLLETIVTSGGIRLQPTRDAIQVFLVEVAKLDALALSRALESKLQAPIWQVRMKAVCVLESILRKKDDEHFSIVASYFGENRDSVVRCSESPQTSLREKANRVLNLLDGEHLGSLLCNSDKLVKAETFSVQMPDLIDTGDADDFLGDDLANEPDDKRKVNLPNTAAPLIDDLLGDTFVTGASSRETKSDEDPFADVSFHASDGKEHMTDLFSGMTLDEKLASNGNEITLNKDGPELFDIFGSDPEISKHENQKADFDNLMAGLSSADTVSSKMKHQGTSSKVLSESVFSESSNLSQQAKSDAFRSIFGSEMTGINSSSMFPSGTMPFNIPPGMMLNPALHSQPMNYNTMNTFLAQQQFLAAMTNLQHLSNLNVQNASVSHAVSSRGSGYSSPFPDIFQPNYINQTPSSTMNNPKKEDTRAFDFISDHLAAARDPKRVA